MGEWAVPLLKNLAADDRHESEDKDQKDWRSVSGSSQVSALAH